MAVTVPRRRTKNDEGRMALREHLAELRRRFMRCAVAILIGGIIGWFLANPVQQHWINDPVFREAAASGHPMAPNYATIAAAFNIKVKVAFNIGLVLSSPIWLYQIWAFITPGLTRKERRYSLWFIAFAIPLFLAGVALAIDVLPKAITLGSHFALAHTVSYIDADVVITFAIHLIIALGVAFLTPLFLIGLNMMGFLSGRRLLGHWRISVFIAFLFAAVITPSPEPIQMIVLALPLILLYGISVGICLLNDYRRDRARVEDPIYGLSPDEPSPIDNQGHHDDL